MTNHTRRACDRGVLTVGIPGRSSQVGAGRRESFLSQLGQQGLSRCRNPFRGDGNPDNYLIRKVRAGKVKRGTLTGTPREFTRVLQSAWVVSSAGIHGAIIHCPTGSLPNGTQSGGDSLLLNPIRCNAYFTGRFMLLACFSVQSRLMNSVKCFI